MNHLKLTLAERWPLAYIPSVNRMGFIQACALAGLCVALLSFAAPAAANEPAVAQACRADVRKQCAGTRPGDGRMISCLREKEGQLSSACQAQLDQVKACAAEVKQLCGEGQSESDKRQCLKDKRAELSAGCRASAGG